MMAHFASLPNELVREMIKFVQPEDLEKFALLSPNVFALAFPFLVEHRALIRKYRTLRNDTGPGSIAALLKTVITNPLIGSYVQKVELGPLVEARHAVGSDPAVVYSEEELEIFTRAALASECLQKPSEGDVLDEREFWLDEIKGGGEDILLAILLPLLPNVATLSVVADSSRTQRFDSALKRAASAAKPTLSKLTHIRLNPRMPNGYHLAETQKFCSLPSVKVLTAPNAYGLHGLDVLSPNRSSGVTHLKLWENRSHSELLYEFLRGFPNLQSFTYSHARSNYQGPEAFLIRSSLLAHCKSTLQSLTLLAPFCNDTSFMGSLRGFESLREVYTEWSFLIVMTGINRGPRLNENLPDSLVWLKIHDSDSRERYLYEQMIENAQYAREHRVQKLKHLVFGGKWVRWSLDTIDGGLKETCKNMGITLMFSPYAPKSGD